MDPVYIDAIADDLINSQKQSIIIAGNTQSAHVHAMTALLNLLLGNINNTVTYHSRVVDDYRNNLDTFLTQLTNDEFDAVLVLSYNPSYTLTSTQFDTAFKNSKNTVYLASIADETSATASWVIGKSHSFESWGI